MDKKNPLTKNEFYIYDNLKDLNNIINTKQLQNIFVNINKKNLNYLINNLIKKKYLIRLKRSFFIVNKAYDIKTLFKIATSLTYGYVSYSSALYNYGLLDYEPFTIFASSYKQSKDYKINNYLIKTIYTQKEHFSFISKNNDFYISSLEKTIFDCINNPKYCGGFAIITKAIFDSYKKIDWNKFIEIYSKLASNRSCQITGYLLDLLINNTQIIIPKFVIDFLETKVKSRTYISNINIKNYIYIKKWKLKDNIGKNKILSWWY